MMLGARIFGILVGVVWAGTALAYEPIRNPELLLAPEPEELVQVAGSRVILADYDLLRRDFVELANLTPDQIDQWLLKYTSYISIPQAKQSEVNTRIQTTEGTVWAYRPKSYGRAVVFQTGRDGLIDSKGSGAIEPGWGSHENGLLALGEAIREFAYEKLVSRIFEVSNADVETVGSYAVIDWGFEILGDNQSKAPAGLILRQAHRRSKLDCSSLNQTQSLKIEKILRRFGLTSAGAYREEEVEKINIQGTAKGEAIVDFGAFLTVADFQKPAKNFDGERVLLKPGYPSFIQPNAEYRVPFEIWGSTITGRDDARYDNPWVWSHELAANLTNGSASRADAEQHLKNLLMPAFEKFKNYVQPCSSLLNRRS